MLGMVLAQTTTTGDTTTAESTAADPSEIYDGLIIGVGRGTFAIIVCIFISVTACFFKSAVVYSNLCIFVATLLPVLTFLIIYLSPKESLASDKTQDDLLPTSWYYMKSIFFLALIFLVFIFSIIALCAIKVTKV